MTKVIALANHKGGVGKTSSTMSIGAGLALQKKKVLLLDLDPQANLTQCCGLENPSVTIYPALRGKEALQVHKLNPYLDIVPASLDLAGVEVELAGQLARETVLKKLLEPVQQAYDYVLLDCPPSLGLLCINALAAAERVYIPQQAQFLSLHGLDKLLEIVELVRSHFNPALQVGGVLITQYDQRKVLNRDIAQSVRAQFGDKVFTTMIRDNVALAEAPSAGLDIFRYAPKSKGAADYKALVKEIIRREEGQNG